MSEATTIEPARERTPGTVDPFAVFVSGLDEPDWLVARRREAWSRYLELPMPTRKSEEWRYTDLGDLRPEALTPATPTAAPTSDQIPASVREVLERSGARAGVLVELNGRTVHAELDPGLIERGVSLVPLSIAARTHRDRVERHLYALPVATSEEKLWQLHLAFLSGGYLLHVPKGVEIEAPIHTFRLIDRPRTLVASSSLVIVESGAGVTVIDELLSPDLEDVLSLSSARILGRENARADYISLQRYGRGVRHFQMQHGVAERDARLHGFSVTLGADLARGDISSRLEGPGADSEMFALWFGDGTQHIDHQTLQHHEAPHAHSDLLFKGALADGSSSVFRGLIRVDPGAQLTDAYQTNRNLLLSDDAHATTLPNLEIEADDVRCSHGATVGQVDEGQMFYLMSRGLSRRQAERLLVFGFFDEVLARLPVEGVRRRVREAIADKIGL